jgi:hypothetical protein
MSVHRCEVSEVSELSVIVGDSKVLSEVSSGGERCGGAVVQSL